MVSQVGADKISNSSLYSKATKREKCFDEKIQKQQNDLIFIKVMRVLIMFQF